MPVSTHLPCAEGQARAGANAEAPCAPASRRWLLAATILASSMVFIDGTVVNVALPALQQAFRAGVAEVQWVVESYALLLAALLLVGGAAGDRYGRRRVFIIGVTLFSAASLWCGLSADIGQLIVARAVQGVGGALLVPGSLAIISASFAERERGAAIGTWSGYSAITAALGPVLGGFLVQHWSWRYAFLINVPLGLAVLALTIRHVPESRNANAPARLDWSGAALASVALGCLVYGLIASSDSGWGEPRVLGALLAALALLAVFIRVERHHAAPMLPLGLFRSRDFSGANLLTLLLYAAGWRLVFPAAQPDPGAGLHGDGGWCRAAAVHRHPVRVLALYGRPGRALRRAPAAGGRAGHRRRRLRAVRLAGRGRQLLAYLFSGRAGARRRHDDRRRAADDDGDELGRRQRGRRRVGRQQCRLAGGGLAGGRAAGHGDELGLQCRAGAACGGRRRAAVCQAASAGAARAARRDRAAGRAGRGAAPCLEGRHRRRFRARFPHGDAAVGAAGAAQRRERLVANRQGRAGVGRDGLRLDSAAAFAAALSERPSFLRQSPQHELAEQVRCGLALADGSFIRGSMRTTAP